MGLERNKEFTGELLSAVTGVVPLVLDPYDFGNPSSLTGDRTAAVKTYSYIHAAGFSRLSVEADLTGVSSYTVQGNNGDPTADPWINLATAETADGIKQLTDLSVKWLRLNLATSGGDATFRGLLSA